MTGEDNWTNVGMTVLVPDADVNIWDVGPPNFINEGGVAAVKVTGITTLAVESGGEALTRAGISSFGDDDASSFTFESVGEFTTGLWPGEPSL